VTLGDSVAQWLGHWTRVQQVTAMRGFNSQPRRYPATTLGKLFTPVCLCSPSSIIWYLARAFMLMRRYVAASHGSNERGEYCSSVFCSDLDRLEPRYK